MAGTITYLRFRTGCALAHELHVDTTSTGALQELHADTSWAAGAKTWRSLRCGKPNVSRAYKSSQRVLR